MDGLAKFLFTNYKRQNMHSEIDYIHIEIKKGAIASFTKTPTAETLAMVRKLVERWEEKVNKNLVKPDVSGNEAVPENKQSGEVAVCLNCGSKRRVTVYRQGICQDCGQIWI
jgi:hypothetical protein